MMLAANETDDICLKRPSANFDAEWGSPLVKSLTGSVRPCCSISKAEKDVKSAEERRQMRSTTTRTRRGLYRAITVLLSEPSLLQGAPGDESGITSLSMMKSRERRPEKLLISSSVSSSPLAILLPASAYSEMLSSPRPRWTRLVG